VERIADMNHRLRQKKWVGARKKHPHIYTYKGETFQAKGINDAIKVIRNRKDYVEYSKEPFYQDQYFPEQTGFSKTGYIRFTWNVPPRPDLYHEDQPKRIGFLKQILSLAKNAILDLRLLCQAWVLRQNKRKQP
jgi:hypothetical protein